MPTGRILAELSRLYPGGYRAFTLGGRRVMEAVIYPCSFGFRVNIDGAWHLFDRSGAFASLGYDNRIVGRKAG